MDFENLQQELSKIDQSNPGSWPLFLKIAVCIAIIIGMIFAGYKFVISSKINQLDKEKKTELTLREEFENKAFQASHLGAYEKQLESIKASFAELLNQLPDSKQVSDLLRDVTQAAINSGLPTPDVTMKDNQPKDFYSEVPIEFSFKGGYHQFAEFIAAVANLSRIVTVHDFSINPEPNNSNKSVLVNQIKMTAKTYIYENKGDQDGSR